VKESFLVRLGTPAAIDDERDAVVRCSSRTLAERTQESWVKVGYTRNIVIEDRCAIRDGTVSLAKRTTLLTPRECAVSLPKRTTVLTAGNIDGRCGRRGRGRHLEAERCGDRRDNEEQAGDAELANPNPTGRRSCWQAVRHASIQGDIVLPARMWFSICLRNAPARSIGACAC
jgi:hypothetical protein